MKRTILIVSLLCLLGCSEVYGQAWNEWFRQRKTQRRYLRKQIVLLKIYLKYLKDGYEIAQDGLTLVSDITDGEFSLHKNYFSSLKSVNPHIASSSLVADLFVLQKQVVRITSELSSFTDGNEHLTPEEVKYVTLVCANMLSLTEKSVSELMILIRSGESEMTDDERLHRIGKLHGDMQDKMTFMQSFAADLRMVASERERDRNAIEQLRKQHDLI